MNDFCNNEDLSYVLTFANSNIMFSGSIADEKVDQTRSVNGAKNR